MIDKHYRYLTNIKKNIITEITLINRNNLLITKITLTCTEITSKSMNSSSKLCKNVGFFYNILIMFTWVFSINYMEKHYLKWR